MIRKKPVFLFRADYEDLQLAKYWRDEALSGRFPNTLAWCRIRMREHALSWAARRRKAKPAAYRPPYADAA